MGRTDGYWAIYTGTLVDRGDFNVILNEEEKQGGLQFTSAEAQDFASCIASYTLIELKHKRGSFTWWNGRVGEECIFKRLDRVLANQEFLQLLLSSEVHHLIRPCLALFGVQHLGRTCAKAFQVLEFWDQA